MLLCAWSLPVNFQSTNDKKDNSTRILQTFQIQEQLNLVTAIGLCPPDPFLLFCSNVSHWLPLWVCFCNLNSSWSCFLKGTSMCCFMVLFCHFAFSYFSSLYLDGWNWAQSFSVREMGRQLNLLLMQMCLILGVLPFHGSAGNKFWFLWLIIFDQYNRIDYKLVFISFKL